MTDPGARSSGPTVPSPETFEAVFWGVRGSIAVPGAETLRYGGNTPCLEVRCGAHRLIFDAGSGLRGLGVSLAREQQQPPLDLFLTHCHTDHVVGFPFFAPLYRAETSLHVWSGQAGSARPIESILTTLMDDPFHPVPLNAVPARLGYTDFQPGTVLRPQPGIVVRTAPLNHPNGAVGYRIEYAGRSLCYITDTEHFPDRIDEGIAALIAGAEIVIYDAMFLPEEYPAYIGWGHSTWEAGIRLVEAAGAGTLILFHHAPERIDDELDRIAAIVDAARPGTLLAAEGMILRPGTQTPPFDGRPVANRL